MSTHISTHNPVRSDVTTLDAGRRAPAPVRSRLWAFAGVAAGLAGIASMVTSSLVDAVYDKDLVGDPAGRAAKLADQTGPMLAFHVVTVAGALLLVVFAAGLHRRLRAAVGESLAPMVAFAGLAGTAVVSILGSGLDTEFIFGLKDDIVEDDNAILYNHWVGTIPWCWVLAGLAGLAVFAAARQGVVPRWLGVVGLVLGGLTVVGGVAPAQYVALMTGSVWLLVTAIGFAVGDKAYRGA